MAQKGCSRSEAERYIEGGWVSVDGRVVEEPMFRVGSQRVDVDAHASVLEAAAVTLLLNKPPDWDAMAATGARSAQSLLRADTHCAAVTGQDSRPGRILKRHFNGLTACVPLEPAASGLVVFTQDWRVARKLTEDAALVEHELMVEVAGAVSPEALNKLNHSGKRDDEALPPVKASVSSTSDTATRLRFAVKGAHPGLIAWLCERAGLQIQGMKRIRIGRVGLGQVPVGQWRYMAAHERF
jgi:23S rRNA pseudouridine2604 synthase